jgi:hypothetical protein
MLRLSTAIEKAVPGVEIDEGVGRPSSFEVTVSGVDDGKRFIVHSKLATGSFCDDSPVAKAIAEYATTGKVPEGWKQMV